MTQSLFMGFPILCRDDGGRKESPYGLLAGPAEYLFGLDVPVNNDSGGIHPDEAIERQLDDAPRVSLALAQRRFGLSGERALLLRMRVIPSARGSRSTARVRTWESPRRHQPDQGSRSEEHTSELQSQ